MTADASTASGTVHRHEVIIIGAGFSGVGAAIKLKEQGVEDFVVLDGGAEVGGTWRDNTYPGAACDVPSQLYSFSFDLNPEWSFAYAPGDEIQRYLVAVSHRHGVRPHLRLSRLVTEARWIERDGCWRVRCESGEVFEGRVCIAGIGSLRDPAYPDIRGRDSFAGASMHSARWSHDVSLQGKRVGVIGTGASAIQVVPAICEQTERVTLFQRTPPWVLPRDNHSYPGWLKALYRALPPLQRLHRNAIYCRMESRFVLFGPVGELLAKPVHEFAKKSIAERVSDPALCDQLTPDYRLGCKRILISDDYYEALMRDDVDLCTSGIDAIVEDGITTNDGRHIELDVLVYCTGFRVEKPLGCLQVYGRDGRSLDEEWSARPSSYMGMTVPGYPNMFMLVGPNAGLGHNSIIFMIEAQLRYIMDAIRQLKDVRAFDLMPAALRQFEQEVDERSKGQVWTTGCESWYLGKDGVNFALWPGSTVEFWLRTRRFDPSIYRVDRQPAGVPTLSPAHA